MCTFYRKSKEESFIGYKIVVKIGDEYFSPATGIKYEDGRPIPEIESGSPLVSCYLDVLDEDTMAYNPEMIGRTAAFLRLKSAMLEKEDLEPYLTVGSLCVLKVKISDDVLEGSYGTYSVVAGRIMEFIEEVQN